MYVKKALETGKPIGKSSSNSSQHSTGPVKVSNSRFRRTIEQTDPNFSLTQKQIRRDSAACLFNAIGA